MWPAAPSGLIRFSWIVAKSSPSQISSCTWPHIPSAWPQWQQRLEAHAGSINYANRRALAALADGGDFKEKIMAARVYTAPHLEELGTFERLTRGVGCPDALDATFPAGTPVGDLTCGVEDGFS